MTARVAIVHDYFCNLGGSDAVARALHDLYPGAPVFTLLLYARNRETELVRGMDLRTSFIQRLPFADRTHQPFLPLMPVAIEQFDLSGFELILSSSHTTAKGIIPPPGALHICYCHTPMRYAWDMQAQYFSELPRPARPFAAVTLHWLRQWDVSASARVDFFIANSHFVAQRIWKYYRRDAAVIPPPVDTDFYAPLDAPRQDFYLVAGRLTGYKRADLAVEAFRRLGKRLIIIGDGPELKRLRRGNAPNITFLGATSREILRDHYARARALVFPSVEDFGIVPVEAQAMGCPVIAYAAGGALDTVRAEETGVLFCEQTVASLTDAISRSEKMHFDPNALRAHACYFSAQNFQKRMTAFIETKFDARRGNWI